MLGVPAKIKTPDLLQFSAPCQSELDMMRIITDGSSPNQFMVLLRFRCQVEHFNNGPMNGIVNLLQRIF